MIRNVSKSIAVAVFAPLLFAANAAHAEPRKSTLPEGDSGIAARYRGDEGIENDPAVIFVENFEADSLAAVLERWESVRQRESMSLDDDKPPGSRGKRSLRIERTDGSGGSLYRRLRNRDGGWGYDRVHLRYYVKFAPDCGELHHGISSLGGNHPPTPWPTGGAGSRPDGAKRFSSGIEPYGKAWIWDYYTYWCEMRGSPPAGRTWGNSFIRDPKLAVDKDRWICIEHMIRMNHVGESNGQQALWIDGKLVSHLGKGFPKGLWTWDKFQPGRGGQGVRWGERGRENFRTPEGGEPFEGFRWRTAPELNVNYVWLYVYTERPAGHRITVLLDDVVAATSYIGPLKK